MTFPEFGKRRRAGGLAARRPMPTVTDVAALAGVSVGTASKALNGRGQLRDETRERVLAAAEQLGFQPNALARGLLTGRTYTVGMLTTDSFGRFTIPIMLGVEDALGAGADVDAAVRRPRRPDPRAALRAHAARPPGRRHHRDRPPARPAPADRPTCRSRSSTPTRSSDAPDDLSIAPTTSRAPRWRSTTCCAPAGRRIAHITGPERHLSARRARPAPRDALAAAGRESRAASRCWASGARRWGRDGGEHPAPRRRPVRRGLLRQRPDRPRRGRRAARGRPRASPTTSRWSASTTGR